jgi:hypothetical protein
VLPRRTATPVLTHKRAATAASPPMSQDPRTTGPTCGGHMHWVPRQPRRDRDEAVISFALQSWYQTRITADEQGLLPARGEIPLPAPMVLREAADACITFF